MTSKFQQRHYEAIAEVMQDARELTHDADSGRIALNRMENLLVDLFRSDNYNFMPERFRAACQPGANVKARTNYKVSA